MLNVSKIMTVLNVFSAVKSIHVLFARALAALVLVAATGAACAAPLYHVSVDTGTWSGSGYLNLTLTGLANAVPVTATVSNFQGSFGSSSLTQGQVTGDVAAGFRFVQGPTFNELLQQIDFGGVFSFDVSFAVPQGVLNGSNFGVALVNASLTDYLAGSGGDIGAIALMPQGPDAVFADQRFVSIVEVPEPGSAVLVALGLLVAGWSRARPQAAAPRAK